MFGPVRQGLAAREDEASGVLVEVIGPQVATYNDRGGTAAVPVQAGPSGALNGSAMFKYSLDALSPTRAPSFGNSDASPRNHAMGPARALRHLGSAQAQLVSQPCSVLVVCWAAVAVDAAGGVDLARSDAREVPA